MTGRRSRTRYVPSKAFMLASQSAMANWLLSDGPAQKIAEQLQRELFAALEIKANDKGIQHEIRAAEIAAAHIHDMNTKLYHSCWITLFEQAGWHNSNALHEYIGKVTKREQAEWDAGYLARQIIQQLGRR